MNQLPDLDETVTELVLASVEATALGPPELLQTLWSDYGAILRVAVSEGLVDSVILKLVDASDSAKHPRGWNTSRSHERKLHSYTIERAWYTDYAYNCGSASRVPCCYGAFDLDGQQLIVLEDLDAAGFSARADSLDYRGIRRCLDWLANFHVTFLNVTPHGLWPIGTYWHLETRPDELDAMETGELRDAAPWLDQQLNSCPIQTLVHGDAKLANFCFSPDMQDVAAVDFQYVGGGCGIKDVAYFLGSCLGEDELHSVAPELVDFYFDSIRRCLVLADKNVADEIDDAWRPLFDIAWTDFTRFLRGWMPTHTKLHGYSMEVQKRVLKHWRGSGG